MILCYNDHNEYIHTEAYMEYIGICANKREDVTPAPENYPAHSHSSYELFLKLTSTSIIRRVRQEVFIKR